MGYPMSYQRVINRNGLTRGDYQDAGEYAVVTRPNLALVPPQLKAGTQEHLLESYQQSLEHFQSKMKLLLGDLRRLEHDAVDESATCAHIAARTGIDPDIVAIVLKEFMQW